MERDQREAAFIREVSETRLKPGNDVEALTALYRKIFSRFNFLVACAGGAAAGRRACTDWSTQQGPPPRD